MVKPKECLCGRKLVKKFKINGKDIYLCPLCSYEIAIQTALYNYSEDYIQTLVTAIKNRRILNERNKI